MGMFDTVRSSYKILGCPFDHEMQTKDLMCSMAHYWISPVGDLYEISMRDTADYVMKPESDRRGPWDTIGWSLNGNRGRVLITPWWGGVLVYPTQWDGPWQDRPCANLWFKDGRINDVTTSTMGNMP